MIDRKDVIEEQRLRKVVRKLIEKVKTQRVETEKLEEAKLRNVIRKAIISEKTAVNDEIPHEKTGINKLRQTLKKIIPQIRDAYLSLTTDPEQRKSYIAHLINGIDNLLAPIETNIDAPKPALTEEMDEDIEIDVGDEKEEPLDLGMDILPTPEEEEEEAIEIDDDEELLTRGLDAENDATGRNAALDTFKQIQGTIVNDFGTLANDEDRELYHDYLKTNILLWKDNFEEFLTSNLPEPTTPEYEKEKAGGDQEIGPDIEQELTLEIIDI